MLKLKSLAIAALSASLALGQFASAPLFSPRVFAAGSGTETPIPGGAPPQEGRPEAEQPAAQEPPGAQTPESEQEQSGETSPPAEVQPPADGGQKTVPEIEPGEGAAAPDSTDAAVSGMNLALNKPVTVSSALPQHPGVYLTDGRLDRMWSTSDTGWQSSPLADEWAMVDLGSVQPIKRWTVYHGASGTWATQDFQLEYSSGDMNGPWQTADSVVGNMDAVTDRVLPDAVSARYVRLHVTKKTAEGVDWPAVRISELELYAQAAVVPVLTAEPQSGTVLPGTQVKLSSSPGTAAVYYTTDGTDPVTSETRHKYIEPITVESDMSIKAVAIDEKGGGVSEIGSFEYRVLTEDFSQYPNLALTATAEMSSPAGWGNVAGRAIDGNPGTYAQPEQNVLWDLTVDLGRSQPVNYAVLRKNPDHVNYVTKFTIDASEDGEHWTTVAEETGNDDSKDQVYGFAPTKARYVRLHQLEKVGIAAAIWEFELYNTAVVLPVEASVKPGPVIDGTKVELFGGQPGATIYYTTDGTDPRTSDTKTPYKEPIVLHGEGIGKITKLQAYAAKEGKEDSEVKTFEYQVIPLSADPPPGDVAAGTAVALSSSVPGASIFYTLDGSDPLTSAARKQYADPVVIEDDVTIRAYVTDGTDKSLTASMTYSILRDETNVALSKVASASSSQPTAGPANAVDGKDETAWIAGSTEPNSWLLVDLGRDYELTGTQITWNEAKNYKYKIEVSADALHWYQAADQTGISGRDQVRKDRFLETARRYVRITVTGLEPGTKAGIREFAVWGTPSDPMPNVPVGPETNGWPRPVIVPLPASVNGVPDPVVSLNGTWKFKLNPGQGFWRNGTDTSDWKEVRVPANLEVLGFDIRGQQGGDWFPDRNIEHAYRKTVDIPETFQSSKVMLRFEAAFNYARVWVNGHLVRQHRGGFTTFDADITEYVTPGEPATITVGLTAETGFIEYQHVRGLVGQVKLFALPVDHMTRLQTETEFDAAYSDAILKVSAGMALEEAKQGEVELQLTDPDGKEVPIQSSVISVTGDQPEASIQIPVAKPAKWDAEHPRLYTLKATVMAGGKPVQTVIRKVGFRSIRMEGNAMLVNGKVVKLRGVDWHQSSPLIGVAADPEHDRESLVKLKEANVNYIRASHWPQYEYVLDLADELGFYVEQENSVMFVSDGRASDPKYLNNYMGQFSETIEKDRSHPSIVIWSVGNESAWGSNVAATHDYVKAVDPSRPVKFSWGFNAPAGYTDLFSIHYTPYGHTFGTHDKPELYDEYAHGYVYYGDWIDDDPAYRDFYGTALHRLWDDLYETPGVLGGAIWHSRDLRFYGPNGIWQGFLVNWGILDEWNREKPEYWNVKKAYSPVRINADSLPNPGAGKQLTIPIENRYNHTNLSEVTIEWSVGKEKGKIQGPSVEPMSKGQLALPARKWKNGDAIRLKIYRDDHTAANPLVDEYMLTIGQKTIVPWKPQGKTPDIKETKGEIIVTGKDFRMVFSKLTGMITSGEYQGKTLLTGGPYLDLGYTSKLGAWTPSGISQSISGKEAVIRISGKYGATSVDFEMRIDGKGLISTTYTVADPPEIYDAVGVSFDAAAGADRITWDRNGEWNVYPEDQIGRLSGAAYKERAEGEEKYGVKPDWPWMEDEKEGLGTADFRASKTNVNYASLIFGKSGNRVSVQGDGSGSVKASLNADSSVRLHIRNGWSHPAGFPGWIEANPVQKPIAISSGYSGTVRMKLTDRDDFEFNFTDAPQYLSDMEWADATSGWGRVRKDWSVGGNALTLYDGKGSRSYEKGLGTHASSEIRYSIGSKGYKRFTATVGIDQESNGGSAVFQVWADGVKLFDSGAMNRSMPARQADVDISGKNELKLVVLDGGDGNAEDHADWADAKLTPAR
ncbi:discoidin domain-containing protein [Paenibacillus sp. VCA1]|uniref:discoidin domain-containing protein n=1 Tax=Paenibacillus sp. VCA1 TaxID=3039148 RepID=UPI002871FA76|nr:discoidin domain-containing protein [Paenibacillus sp. VCA1]MDR9854235.1 discoidin domain-containing protein [Paenibacillus sp. VCA1]